MVCCSIQLEDANRKGDIWAKETIMHQRLKPEHLPTLASTTHMMPCTLGKLLRCGGAHMGFLKHIDISLN